MAILRARRLAAGRRSRRVRAGVLLEERGRRRGPGRRRLDGGLARAATHPGRAPGLASRTMCGDSSTTPSADPVTGRRGTAGWPISPVVGSRSGWGMVRRADRCTDGSRVHGHPLATRSQPPHVAPAGADTVAASSVFVLRPALEFSAPVGRPKGTQGPRSWWSQTRHRTRPRGRHRDRKAGVRPPRCCAPGRARTGHHPARHARPPRSGAGARPSRGSVSVV